MFSVSSLCSAVLVGLSAVVATPSIMEERVPGPGGSVIRPPGGYNTYVGTPFLFAYNPVLYADTSSGEVATSYIDLDMWVISTDQTYPLARGLTAFQSIDSANSIIAQAFQFLGSPFLGNLELIVTEHQTGGLKAAPFRSAAPFIAFTPPESPFGSQPTALGHGTILSPKEGDVLEQIVGFTVVYNPDILSTLSIDIDIQNATSSPTDNKSYSVIGHYISQSSSTLPELNITATFQPQGVACGAKRLRFTEHRHEASTSLLSTAVQYVNVTLTNCVY